MTPRPIGFRLVAPFAVMIALIVGVCGLVIYWAGERQTRLQQIHDLDGLAPLVRQWVHDDVQLTAPTRDRLLDAGRILHARITLIDGSGKVTFDTLAEPSTMDNHNARPEVAEARKLGVGAEVRFSRTLDEQSVYVAQLLNPADSSGMVVRVSYPRHAWAEVGTPVWAVVCGGIATAIAAVMIFWLILQRQWITPTRKLAEAADRMAAGEWDRRVQPRGADELRAFSSRLNFVAAHAQKQLADLNHQRADLQSLVDTLPDPILVSDANGKLALLNKAASQLLNMSAARAIGQPVVNVSTDEAVLQLIERVRERRLAGAEAALQRTIPAKAGNGSAASPVLTREIRLNRNGNWLTYQAVATSTADGGVLLVLRDVTALAAMVQMKTDFVANASHELRTPIAAIKIAFETLQEVYVDDPEQTERCLRIIDGHLRRLEEMLRDLLDMAKVESATLKPHLKRVATQDVFTQLRSALGTMARQKLVELQFGDGKPGVSKFLGDERLLNLVLKNLMENSIKFTPPGGSVTLRVFEQADGVVIPGRQVAEASGPADPLKEEAEGPMALPVVFSVIDTGIGIPPEHLDRVFERFYQVDPARSGSAGRGTGLGLAIVKHAVAAMGGKVYVDSTVGTGTTVSCVLPQPLDMPAERPADEGEAVMETVKR